MLLEYQNRSSLQHSVRDGSTSDIMLGVLPQWQHAQVAARAITHTSVDSAGEGWSLDAWRPPLVGPLALEEPLHQLQKT